MRIKVKVIPENGPAEAYEFTGPGAESLRQYMRGFEKSYLDASSVPSALSTGKPGFLKRIFKLK